MRYTFILMIILPAIIITACSTGNPNPEKKIKKLENELFTEEAIFDDDAREKALELVQAYLDFAEQNPDDPQSPDYLFKAGDITMNLDNAGKAISIYNRIIYSYPDYEKSPECLFLVAYIHENHLMNYGKAKELYEMFIEKYPDNEFADDAQMSIRNMGKTPEELIKEFEQQNAEVQDAGD